MNIGAIGNKVSFGNDLFAEVSRPPANAHFVPSTDSPLVPESDGPVEKPRKAFFIKSLFALAVVATILGVVRRNVDAISTIRLDGFSQQKGFGAKAKYVIAKLGQYPVDAFTFVQKLVKGDTVNASNEVGDVVGQADAEMLKRPNMHGVGVAP